jgi:hypothetical protein
MQELLGESWLKDSARDALEAHTLYVVYTVQGLGLGSSV